MKRVLRKDSNCIDVGCHTGEILTWILKLCPKGIHFAFEPIPDLYRYLIQSFSKYPHILIYDYALSDTEGLAKFHYVISNPGYSGFLRRRYDRGNEIVEEITVRTQRLDNIVPENMRVDFLKIDVEGAKDGSLS